MAIPQQTDPGQKIIAAGLILGLFALAGVGLLVYIHLTTQARVEYNATHSLIKTLNEIIPTENYNNNLFDDSITVQSPAHLGTPEPVTVYRARLQNKPIASIFTLVSPHGYSGNIKLLIGIYADGKIAGVRVLAHRETPGLGDRIELRKSNWILSFNQKSLTHPDTEHWRVKRDGGAFDAFTGATVTPRAIVNAVHNSLTFVQAHQTTLFNQPTGSRLTL